MTCVCEWTRYLVSSHVGLQQGVFLLQVLDTGQVFAVVVRSQVALHLIQPQLDVLHVPVELLLLVGLPQLDAWPQRSVRLEYQFSIISNETYKVYLHFHQSLMYQSCVFFVNSKRNTKVIPRCNGQYFP